MEFLIHCVDKKSAIPEISYSSSDDDDFFDAEDEEEEDGPKTQKELLDLELKELQEKEEVIMPQSPLTPTDNVDFDALYENNEEDNEDVDMKSHGSVITHLLSQVRIGMDLTKIVLPTFILERRSLLEMYSDFFAHPGLIFCLIDESTPLTTFYPLLDLFIGITDGPTPEERMVRVLRWYLSSFHAGRKSSIAKKPYNPILGETFRCHWRLDPETADKLEPYRESPLPWCNKKDLTFIAEQANTQFTLYL